MAARDRLAALKVQAQTDYDDEDETEELYSQPETEKELKMKQFFDEVEELHEMMRSFQKNVNEVKVLQSTIISLPHADEKTKNQLDDIMAEIKKTTTQIRGKLKRIEQEIEQDEHSNQLRHAGPDGSAPARPQYEAADLRIRKTQHATFSRQFVDVMTEYNRSQADYRDRCKAKLQRQLELTGQKMSDQELDTLLEQDNPAVFTQGIVMDNTQQAKQTLADIEARHADIMKLETSIRELHDMFMDMAILVEAQGEMINRIEFNVENSVDYVEEALVDTKKAIEYQSKARRKKIMMLLCGLIVGFAVVSYVASLVMPSGMFF